jgi:hypothetical protein
MTIAVITSSAIVMPGLVPGIHALRRLQRIEAWMAGASPAMTEILMLRAG